ncbi:IS3 family transposase [Mangrovibacillus cuniculi]|uniref:IS3 family transposase n=1 Tax=Mangrovibacillus cuniculi TaxID=2593652 RepID=A0A7S8HFW0_9BACI|nr:IS3 family transposase [Mangrovibacillus cuniculi]QPC46222.1 IS3 family transposase [Mangrovibacillus cuniculi]QPC46941.1 IS3 family transposase [Mangrovibacillus cuniculi]QPC47295.1 IS3 family transposase [Mangrovibacillus cuniculi]
MSQFSKEQKLLAVYRYQTENVSYRSLSKELGIDPSVLRHWVALVHYHGDTAFSFPYTNYSSAFKLKVIKSVKGLDYSIRKAAAIFQIPDPSMVRKWIRKWESQGSQAFQEEVRLVDMTKSKNTKQDKQSNPSIEELQKELDYLRMENAYLKKLKGLSSGKITKEMKAKVIYELRHEFPVKDLVKVARISRSTYYFIVKCWQRKDPDRKWKRRIKFIYKKHKGRLGYRRITDILQEKGHCINKKKVYRIMGDLGLRCIVRMKKYQSYISGFGKASENILNRNFHASKPNQKWVTDITEFKLFGQKLYFSPILDLFNGEIISYTLQTRPTYDLVEDMMLQALTRKKTSDDLLIHSDQGWHYRMPQYRRLLKDHNITQSMSRKGNCYDNAVIENFFGIFKSEFIQLEQFESVEHFIHELENYIFYYNNLRIKSKLNRKSPVAYRRNYEQAA